MINRQEKPSPFRLETGLRLTAVDKVNRLIASSVEHGSGLRRLEKLYRTAEDAASHLEFTHKILAELDVTHNLKQQADRIPARGSAIIVANHPFGIIDGVILATVLLAVRPDVKILTNHLLQRIPEVRDLFIGVDPFGGDGSTQRNINPIRSATRWVRQGGLLLVFPAGEVSRLDIRRRIITDAPWSPTIARIIRMSGAPVVPVWFHGNNSPLFQLAGLLHPRLRTALLPREVSNKSRRHVQGHIGKMIGPDTLQRYTDDQQLIDYLRFRTYLLQEAYTATTTDKNPQQTEQIDYRIPVAAARQESMPAKEVAALPLQQCLVQQNQLKVYFAESSQIPWLMQEIGRLRELTFRATGEGSGKSCDIDMYDNYYLQLFVWDHEADRLVGAYRLGLTDRIISRYGVPGLYSHTLFRYRDNLFQQLGSPAIELGRSFVREEYQRSFAPLLLLWKGIGAFVARHPRYRILFGPVSISNAYHSSSQRLLVEFLSRNHFDDNLASKIRPRSPFRASKNKYWQHTLPGIFTDPELISGLIADIETDQKGIPVLIRQYLKLGGRILGFNVDRDFSNSLDGLIMVDLRNTDRRVLQRYMGRDASERFLHYHQTERAVS